MDSDRTYDLVLFGATGFTGGLTADYLAVHAPAGLRWAIAGRNRTRLDAVAHRLGQEPPSFEASVIAAVSTAVFRAAVWDWRESGDDSTLTDRLRDALTALERLR